MPKYQHQLKDHPKCPLLLGIHAKKQSGKGTFARTLRQVAPHRVMTDTVVVPASEEKKNVELPMDDFSFANALKVCCGAIFGGDVNEWFGDEKMKQTRDEFWAERLGEDWATRRKQMQLFGTEIVRERIHWQTWIWSVEARIIRMIEDPAYAGGGIVLFADTRYDNEAKFIKNHGGMVVNLSRPNYPHQDGHSSEAGIDPKWFDHDYLASTTDEVVENALAFYRDVLCPEQEK